MINLVDFTDLPRPEQIDIFIKEINGSLHQVEIINILSIFTAYKLRNEIYEKYYEGCTTEDIIERLNFQLTETNFDDEDESWNVVIDTLCTDKVLNIIDNIKVYMETYLKITHVLDDMKNIMLRLYANGGITYTN